MFEKNAPPINTQVITYQLMTFQAVGDVQDQVGVDGGGGSKAHPVWLSQDSGDNQGFHNTLTQA